MVTVRQDDVTTGSNDRILLQVSQTGPPTVIATGKVAVQTDRQTDTTTGYTSKFLTPQNYTWDVLEAELKKQPQQVFDGGNNRKKEKTTTTGYKPFLGC